MVRDSPAEQPVRVALVAPLSGDHAALGEALANVTTLAIEELAPAGVRVEVEPVDACDAGSAAAATDRLIGDHDLAAVLGPTCSAGADELLPALETAGVVAVSGGATADGLGSLAPTTFHRVVPDETTLAGLGQELGQVEDMPAVTELYQRYELRFGALPADHYRAYLAYGYDAAAVLLRAAIGQVVADGQSELDRAALTVAVRSTDGYQGLTGAITFDLAGNRRYP